VIPCFNDGSTLGETVASVQAQERCELVVVDDGSDDVTTQRILRELENAGVRVVHQVNQGLSRARMTGVAVTAAPYLHPLDSDDRLEPGALTVLADALDSHPRSAVAWGDTRVFGDLEYTIRHGPNALDPWRLTFFNGLPYAAMFRREALLEVGGWQQEGGYEDWDLWMSFAERDYTGRYVSAVTSLYRIHGNRMWRDAVNQHEQIFAAMRNRHPQLFARRGVNRRRSRANWLTKLMLPLIEALPVSYLAKRRLYMVITDPRRTLATVRHRLGRFRA
jgi:glycosyltransferase involved in cell wall biosynthesis